MGYTVHCVNGHKHPSVLMYACRQFMVSDLSPSETLSIHIRFKHLCKPIEQAIFYTFCQLCSIFTCSLLFLKPQEYFLPHGYDRFNSLHENVGSSHFTLHSSNSLILHNSERKLSSFSASSSLVTFNSSTFKIYHETSRSCNLSGC